MAVACSHLLQPTQQIGLYPARSHFLCSFFRIHGKHRTPTSETVSSEFCKNNALAYDLFLMRDSRSILRRILSAAFASSISSASQANMLQSSSAWIANRRIPALLRGSLNGLRFMAGTPCISCCVPRRSYRRSACGNRGRCRLDAVGCGASKSSTS